MKKTMAVLTLVFLLAACVAEPEPRETAASPDPAPTESSEPTPSHSPEASASPTSAPDGERELEVWFTYGDRLFVTRRVVPGTPAVGRAAMEQLLARPDDFESNAGVATAVPPGTELLGLRIEDGIAIVDLSGEYGSTGGGTTTEALAVAQVVYTLTQFDTVKGVSFELEGEPLEMTPGHGILLDGPQTRRDWKVNLPSILVRSPSMGDRVSSPMTVEGTADVFEATVQMRLLDAQGNRLAKAFTTATCGTGCRGDFEHQLEFSVPSEQHGVLEVWWDSPEDGSRRDVVQIAVTLVP